MEKWKEGLGEACTFASYHPLTNLIFYGLAVGIAMFATRPVFILIAFFCSWVYSILLGGEKACRKNLLLMIPIVLVMAVINVLFTHDGETVLFYLNGNRITLEALYFGIASAAILTLIIVWFTSFHVIFGAEKIVYLFGKTAPVLGLTLSMIFRFIPLFKARYREIHMGQQCMGRGGKKRIRQFLKEISILISWSLESSIETADSMEARGYGLKGRTSFSLFQLTKKDILALGFMAVSGLLALAGCIAGEMKLQYYPEFHLQSMDLPTAVIAISYLALLLMPAAIDLMGERKWNRLESMA